MRDSENLLRPEPPPVDRHDHGTPNGPDGIDRSFAVLESAFAAVRERVERLEADVRNLQSQNVNRS